MSIKVFIDGGEGTTGLRLAERLGNRADVTLLGIDPALRKDPAEKARISNSADVVFLCLPDEAAKQAVAAITNPDVKIIDASTAHRTADGWDYGLPELSSAHRMCIGMSTRVSVPGCHAMGFALLAYPLVAGGMLPADAPVTAYSITGYSGGGKGMIADYENPDRADYFRYPRQYALGQQHKHLPEMQKASRLSYPPVFNPILGDFYSGMLVTLPLHARLLQTVVPGTAGAKVLWQYYTDFYQGQALVSVLPWGAEKDLPGGTLDPCLLSGKDRAQIAVCGNEDRIIVTACFDNLGKGASGAAIQNMNLMCGLDETAGLEL